MNVRSKIFWSIWLLVVIAVLWWMSSIMAHGRSHHLAPKPVTQGLGAADLIAREKATHRAPYIPSIIIPPKPPRVWYFSVTAMDISGLESDFSNEVSYTNYSRTNVIMTLDWEPSAENNFIARYTIYKGLSSGNYLWKYDAGTSLCFTMPLFGFPLSNIVITITSRNATNLQWTTKIGQPWTFLGATNWTATNPATRLWRATGKSPTELGEVFVSAYRF